MRRPFEVVANMLGYQYTKPDTETDFVAVLSGNKAEIKTKKELTEKLHGYVASCQHAIANAVAGLDIKAVDGTGMRLRNSDQLVTNAFTCKRVKLTKQDLLYKLASDLALTGNAYMVLLAQGDVSLEYVSGEVKVGKWTTYGGLVTAPQEYIVTPDSNSGVETTLEADKMVHFKYRLMTGAASGRGALEDCILESDTATEIARFVSGYFKNSAIPGLHLKVKKGTVNAKKFRKFAEKIQESFGGAGRGGTFVTTDGVTAQVLGNSLVDSKSVDVLAAMKMLICGAYGVPVDIIDSTNSNRAANAIAFKIFHQNTVMPLAHAICDRMSLVYGVRFEPIPYDTIDPIEGDKVLSQLVEKGVIRPEEARKYVRSVSLIESGKESA